jgi:2'-5' RNA ligase
VHIGFDDPPKDNQILTSIGAPTVAFGDLAFFHNSNVFDVDQKRHERDVVYVSVDDVTGSIDALCTALEKDSGFPYPHPTKTKHITLLYAKYGSGDKVIELLKQAGIGKLLQGQHKCGQLHFKRVRDRTSKPLIVELDS